MTFKFIAAVSLIAVATSAQAVSVTTSAIGVIDPDDVMLCDGVGDCGGSLTGDFLNFSATNPGVAAALPGNSSQQIAVLGGKSATLAVGKYLQSFSFDWGSNDAYNFVDIKFGDGSVFNFSGAMIPPANGNQTSLGTNFRAKFDFGGTKLVDNVVFRSNQNSFEFDNVSGGVPEPATWAMLIAGFGLVGTAARRRRTVAVAA
jgi:hypothetical protein